MKVRAVLSVWLTGALVLLAAAGIDYFSRGYEAQQRIDHHINAVHSFVDHAAHDEVDTLIHDFLRHHVPSSEEVLAGELQDGTIIRMERAGANLNDETVLAYTAGDSASNRIFGSRIKIEDMRGNSAAVLVVVDKQRQIQKDHRNLALLALITVAVCALLTLFTALELPGRRQSSHTQTK